MLRFIEVELRQIQESGTLPVFEKESDNKLYVSN